MDQTPRTRVQGVRITAQCGRAQGDTHKAKAGLGMGLGASVHPLMAVRSVEVHRAALMVQTYL